jgi:hypothetical protein
MHIPVIGCLVHGAKVIVPSLEIDAPVIVIQSQDSG